jgi:UDP-N-acetylglucosamine 2-epimerase (non-hydrolysing)
VTSHRRENWGEPLEAVCAALLDLAARYEDVLVVYPVHPNPRVREVTDRLLKGAERVCLLDPLDYRSFVAMMNASYLIVTDSGGVQEEAPSLGKPVLVIREKTERPEAVDAGTVKLVGTDRDRIVSEASALLDSDAAYQEMSHRHNPYGDGKACARIVRAVQGYFA